MRMVTICHIFQLKEVYPITKNSNIVEVLMIPDFFDVEIKLKALLIFSSFLPGCFALSSLAVDFIHRFLQYGLHYGIAGNYIYTFTSHETNVNNIVYPQSKNLSIAAFPVYPNMPSLSLIYIYIFIFVSSHTVHHCTMVCRIHLQANVLKCWHLAMGAHVATTTMVFFD